MNKKESIIDIMEDIMKNNAISGPKRAEEDPSYIDPVAMGVLHNHTKDEISRMLDNMLNIRRIVINGIPLV